MLKSIGAILILLNFISCMQQDVSSKRSSQASATKSGNDGRGGAPAGGGDTSFTNTTGVSTILGKVTAADGNTPLAGASVYMVKNNKRIKLKNAKENGGEEDCKTDGNGQFACECEDGEVAPEVGGRTRFKIEKPNVAEKEFEVEVKENKTTEVDVSKTRVEKKDVTGKWLVVPGIYDGVQLLLSQLKGCKLTGDPKQSYALRKSTDCTSAGLDVLDTEEIHGKFTNLAALTPYQFIFINCPTDMTAYDSVIAQYVRQGGHVYFSDWASTGLDAAFPGNIEFGARNTDGGVAGSTVLNNGLRSFLGRSSIPIYFDYAAWVPVGNVADHVKTYIRANTAELGGRADASITVGWREENKGCVFFTSYHIEGASTGANQERSLKYLLLNINQLCI